MMKVSIFLLILVLIIKHISAEDDCQYTTSDGILDLRTLSSKNRPRFVDVPDTDSKALLRYSFNPCFPYTTKSPCENAAACATEVVSGNTKLIARQDGRTFSYASGLSTIHYTDGGNLKLTGFFVCQEKSSVTATKVDDTTYLIYVEDRCACPGKCKYAPEESGGLGGGSIFLIILLTVTAAYLIIGALYLGFVRHEKGLNLVPNRGFWLQRSIDAIIGVRFIIGKVRGGGHYDSV